MPEYPFKALKWFNGIEGILQEPHSLFGRFSSFIDVEGASSLLEETYFIRPRMPELPSHNP